MSRSFLRITRPLATIAAFTLVTTAADCSDPMSPSVEAGATGTTTTTVTGAPIIALRPPLTGAAFARANGKAEFENQGGERELEIEVEDVAAGTALIFYLGTVELARATADAFGNARINLNSDRGANVPASVAGQVVSVTTASGAMVVLGSF